LAASDHATIIAHVGAEQDLPLLRPGDRVYASWAPEASLVLPAGDVAAVDEVSEILDDDLAVSP